MSGFLKSAALAANWPRALLALVLVAAVPLAHAEALLTPLPTPDLSTLPTADAKALAETRRLFDVAKPNLIEAPLAEAFVQMGAEYARFGFDPVAAVAFANAAELMPNDGRWKYLQGVMAQRMKNLSVARGHFEAALALDLTYGPIRMRLVDVLLEQGDVAKARALLEEIEKTQPNYVPALALRGEIAVREKRYPEAVTLLERALKAEPRATRLYTHLADAYAGQGNATEADAARRRAGEVGPALADPLVANMYAPKLQGSPLELATALMQQGRLEEARPHMGRAIAEKPNDVVILSVAARLEAQSGHLDSARILAANALKAQPDSAIAHLTQGGVLEMAGAAADAVTHYELAVRGDLRLPEARLLLGNAQMRAGQFTQAAEQYRQLASIEPANNEAVARLAAAEVAANRCAAALKSVNDARAARPRDAALVQFFVRVVSICPAASAAESTAAIEHARALYKQLPDAAHSEALAQILAATGKFEEAVEYQAQAVFVALRAGDSLAVERYKLGLKRFEARQAATTPWPPGHPYVSPAPLAAGVAAAAKDAAVPPR